MTRGFFEIGIVRSKSPANVGTLWRSAYQMGASGIFTIGKRFPYQPTDTYRTQRHIPYREYEDAEAFTKALPLDCVLIGVEMGGKELKSFVHPERAIYLLGAEDDGIPPELLSQCKYIVSLPSVRAASYNVAVAGSILMFDRQSKRGVF
jgi:tRNA G18 (ribose-2'-O)-methylase SpoU